MFDWLTRRGNPTNSWTRTPGLELIVDLGEATINRVRAGARIEDVSFLGRSSSNEKSPLCFSDLGLVLDFEDDGTFSGFQIALATKFVVWVAKND